MIIQLPAVSEVDAGVRAVLATNRYAPELPGGWPVDAHGLPIVDEEPAVELAVQPGSVPVRSAGDGPRVTTVSSRRSPAMGDVKPGQRYRHGWIPIGGAAPKKLPTGAAHGSRLAVMSDVKSRRAYAAKLSDKDLAATDAELSRRAAALGKPGQVSAHHRVVKEEMAKRRGATGGTDVAAVKSQLAVLDQKRKSGQLTSTMHAQQRAKLLRQLSAAQNQAGRKTVKLSSDAPGIELGKPFPGAAAPFKKGGGRAKPVEGSPAEEAAETPAQEAAERKAGTDKPTMRSGKPKLDVASRRKLARSGAAMPSGAYPITNVASLRDAVHAYGHAKPGERAAVRKHIIKRARQLGAMSRIPQDWLSS